MEDGVHGPKAAPHGSVQERATDKVSEGGVTRQTAVRGTPGVGGGSGQWVPFSTPPHCEGQWAVRSMDGDQAGQGPRGSHAVHCRARPEGSGPRLARQSTAAGWPVTDRRFWSAGVRLRSRAYRGPALLFGIRNGPRAHGGSRGTVSFTGDSPKNSDKPTAVHGRSLAPWPPTVGMTQSPFNAPALTGT